MRNIFKACASLALLGAVSGNVTAADSAGWTGFYMGGLLGAREQEAEWAPNKLYEPAGQYIGPVDIVGSANEKDTDAYLGGYAGYNWALSERILVGAEFSAGYANNVSKHHLLADFGSELSSSVSIKSDWDASLRGRAGYLVTPTVLLYGSAGIAATRMQATGSCDAVDGMPFCNPAYPVVKKTDSKTVLGWTAGFGLEASVAKNLVARAEYQYIDYGTTSYWALSPDEEKSYGFKGDIENITQKFSVGLAYQF